jgi:hypothetical protein
MLMYDEKILLINYLYSLSEFQENTFEYYVKKYIDSKIVKTKSLTSIILFSANKMHVMLFKNKKWHQAEAEDEREVSIAIIQQSDFKNFSLNNYIGFIGFDNKNRYIVFKVKDMEAKRNTGARCDEALKSKKIVILKSIMGEDLFDKYTEGTTKGMVQPELCSLEEFLFRYFNKIKKNKKLWFFDFETAIIYKSELKI